VALGEASANLRYDTEGFPKGFRVDLNIFRRRNLDLKRSEISLLLKFVE